MRKGKKDDGRELAKKALEAFNMAAREDSCPQKIKEAVTMVKRLDRICEWTKMADTLSFLTGIGIRRIQSCDTSVNGEKELLREGFSEYAELWRTELKSLHDDDLMKGFQEECAVAKKEHDPVNLQHLVIAYMTERIHTNTCYEDNDVDTIEELPQPLRQYR